MSATSTLWITHDTTIWMDIQLYAVYGLRFGDGNEVSCRGSQGYLWKNQGPLGMWSVASRQRTVGTVVTYALIICFRRLLSFSNIKNFYRRRRGFVTFEEVCE